ncbi:hypothetical protein PSEMO_27650 [Pseudomonas putida]|uniref:Uncharacterized protein n=1 Tax=Pseudomonas putida TaxID=303 RepID=A0A1Q9R4J9_PSEPU|nr:hypothetical protein PSEMO_27650 [Pseudomonas putida]
MESVPVLDSLRTNLAREVTDNLPYRLPLSAHQGLYRVRKVVATGATPIPGPGAPGIQG